MIIMRIYRDNPVFEKIVQKTSFDYMKSNLHMTHPTKYGENKMNFLRKSIAGNGKNI